MSRLMPYSPNYGTTVEITAGSSSSETTISGAGKTIYCHNTGSNIVFLKVTNATGDSADTADLPLPAGQTLFISQAEGAVTDGKNHASRYFYCIAPTGAPVLYVHTGEGE